MTRSQPDTLPHIPVSWGELIDKVTILEIKTERLVNEKARARVAKELGLLEKIATPALNDKNIRALANRLKAANRALWEVEDQIRHMESKGQFDSAFIELARSIYKHNDQRSALKREINLTLNSELVEEKSYKPY